MTGLTVPDGVSDRFMRVFTQVSDERMSAIPVTACLVWDLRNTPDAALAHIAEGLGLRRVLGGQALRDTLPSGVATMKLRGTRGGLRRAIEAMGYTVSLIGGLQRCDGSIVASGEPYRCGSEGRASELVSVTASSVVEADALRELWGTIDYFGRGSVRHILVVDDPSGQRVFRDHSVEET